MQIDNQNGTIQQSKTIEECENYGENKIIKIQPYEKQIPQFLCQEQEQQNSILDLYFGSSLLHLRGDEKVVMPIQQKECILSYNGEIYLEKCQVSQQKFMFQENDSQQLFNFLYDLCQEFYQQKSQQIDKYHQIITERLKNYNADFSFIFYDGFNNKIIVSKGVFGKRSLLLGFQQNGICISSAPVTLNSQNIQQQEEEKEEEQKQEEGEENNNLGKFIEEKYFQEFISARNKEWIELPSNKVIIGDIMDQSIVWDQYDIDQEIYNLQNLQSQQDVKAKLEIPQDIYDIVYNGLYDSVKKIVQNINEYKYHFTEENKQLQQQQQIQQNNNKEILDKEGVIQTNSKVCILFSGGLDSALLTYFIDKIIPQEASIDLLNLSFSKDAIDRKTAIMAYKELQGINPKRKYNLIMIEKSVEDVQSYEQKLLKIIYPKITHMDFNISMVLHLATKGRGVLYQENQEEKQIQSGAKVVISGLGADEIFGGYSRYRVSFVRDGYQGLYNEMKFDLSRIWIRNLGRDDRAISSNGKEARFPFLDTELIEQVQKIDFGYFTNFSDQPLQQRKKKKQMPNNKKLKNKNQQQDQQLNKEEQKQQEEVKEQEQEEKQEEYSQFNGMRDKRLLRMIAYRVGMVEVSGFKKKAIQFGTGLAKQSNKRAFGSHKKGKGTSEYKLKQ